MSRATPVRQSPVSRRAPGIHMRPRRASVGCIRSDTRTKSAHLFDAPPIQHAYLCPASLSRMCYLRSRRAHASPLPASFCRGCQLKKLLIPSCPGRSLVHLPRVDTCAISAAAAARQQQIDGRHAIVQELAPRIVSLTCVQAEVYRWCRPSRICCECSRSITSQ